MREAKIHKRDIARRGLSPWYARSKCGHLTEVDLLTDDWGKTTCKTCLATRATTDGAAGTDAAALPSEVI